MQPPFECISKRLTERSLCEYVSRYLLYRLLVSSHLTLLLFNYFMQSSRRWHVREFSNSGYRTVTHSPHVLRKTAFDVELRTGPEPICRRVFLEPACLVMAFRTFQDVFKLLFLLSRTTVREQDPFRDPSSPWTLLSAAVRAHTCCEGWL